MQGYSLKKISVSPFPVRILPYLLFGFALLGFFDATYLTIQHYQHVIPPCTIGGCETVLTSSFAILFGLPVSLYGGVFYLVVMIGTAILMTVIAKSETTKQSPISLPRGAYTEHNEYARNDKITFSHLSRFLISFLFLLCCIGFVIGIVFIAIQAFVLHAWCYYCLFSELIDFLLFDTAWWLYNARE